MSISLVGIADSNNADLGVSFAIPVTVQPGDRLLVVAESNSVSGYTHLGAAGWTMLHNSVGVQGGAGGSQITSVHTKVAGTADAGTVVTFEVTPTGSLKVGSLVAYRGTVTTPQVMASAVLSVATNTTAVAVPVVNVAALPTTLVTAATVKSGTSAWTFTPPAGFTQRATDTVSGNAVAIADGAASATGNTAVAAWTKSVSSQAGAGVLIALAEGEVPMQTQPTFHRLTVSGWFPSIG